MSRWLLCLAWTPGRLVSLRHLFRSIFAAAFLAAFSACYAQADIGVVLADPTTIGASVYTHAGHSLVYLSGVCPVSPVKARLCAPGEQGSVVGTYPDFRESAAYGWNLVPLSLYLEGASSPGSRLLYASKNVKRALEDHARSHFLEPVCAPGGCPNLSHAYWRDMVAATAYRDIFIFAVHSTRAQDQAAVDWLNNDANVNHYRGMTNNCANFSSRLINAVLPKSVHRDYLNDLFMMGPKAAARSFTHWSVARPELGFYSLHFAQQPGELPRCTLARSGTETAIHMKKYLIPAALIGDHEVAGSFFVAYYFTGRFGLYKEFEKHPSPGVVELESEAKQAKKSGDMEQAANLRTTIDEQRRLVLGSPEEWEDYERRFAALEPAPGEPLPAAGHEKHSFFPESYGLGEVNIDAEGHAWLLVRDGEQTRRVGIISSNVLAAESDPLLAYRLMLGRVGSALAAKNHARETMRAFREDWILLEKAHDRFARQQPGVVAEKPGAPATPGDGGQVQAVAARP